MTSIAWALALPAILEPDLHGARRHPEHFANAWRWSVGQGPSSKELMSTEAALSRSYNVWPAAAIKPSRGESPCKVAVSPEDHTEATMERLGGRPVDLCRGRASFARVWSR